MSNPNLIGNSLEVCIKHLAGGEVWIEDVIRVETPINIPNSNDPESPEWQKFLEPFLQDPWKGRPNCVRIMKQFIREGKIVHNPEQPPDLPFWTVVKS